MANKYELISKMAEETAKEVVKNGESWKQYLDTAAQIYKYPFQEQLLIYAQRPDATACASIDIWNISMEAPGRIKALRNVCGRLHSVSRWTAMRRYGRTYNI